MVLNRLQQALQYTYDVDIPHRVEDFLFHDRDLAAYMAGQGAVAPVPEQLFMVQDGRDISVSLYIEHQVNQRLRHDDPLECLHGGNLQDFLLALEGVSHFLYLAWNAGHEKVITLLEMELQAEVDKFVTALALCGEQGGQHPVQALLRQLFGPLRLRKGLDAHQRERYATAHHYGARYCEALATRLGRRPHGVPPTLHAELRRFYRMGQAQKLAHIEDHKQGAHS